MSFNAEEASSLISSSDKIHNPVSEKYKRQKAGRKGIGRFATQRLGDKLIIITVSIETNENAIIIKTIESKQAIIFVQFLRFFIR